MAASVTNPKVYTLDTYNYQFIWDNCVDMSKQYELYIYSNQTLLNGNCPILITYNKKIPIHVIERACNTISPIEQVQFKIKNLTINTGDTDDVAVFARQAQAVLGQEPFFPNDLSFSIGATVTDVELISLSEQNNAFKIIYSDTCKEYFNTYYKKDVLFNLMDCGYYMKNCKIISMEKNKYRIFCEDMSQSYSYIYFSENRYSLKKITSIVNSAPSNFDMFLERQIENEGQTSWEKIYSFNDISKEDEFEEVIEAERLRLAIRILSPTGNNLIYDGEFQILYQPDILQLVNIEKFVLWYCTKESYDDHNPNWIKYDNDFGKNLFGEIYITKDNVFDLNTEYIGYISYIRDDENKTEGPVGVRADETTVNFVNSRNQEIPVVPKQWESEEIGSEYYNSLQDIGAVQQIYFPHKWHKDTETWHVRVGNLTRKRKDGTHIVDENEIPVEPITINSEQTLDVSNYTYLELDADTTISKSEAPFDKLVWCNLYFYDKEETRQEKTNNKIQLNIGEKYYRKYNYDCFKGLDSFKVTNYNNGIFTFNFEKYKKPDIISEIVLSDNTEEEGVNINVTNFQKLVIENISLQTENNENEEEITEYVQIYFDDDDEHTQIITTQDEIDVLNYDSVTFEFVEGIQNVTVQVDYSLYQNISNQEVYIYQQQVDLSADYRLCNSDATFFDNFTSQGTIMDPEVSSLHGAPLLICLDIPVLDDNNQIKTTVSEEEISNALKGLEGYYDKLNAFEVLNIKTDEHPEGDFKDSFIWDKMNIKDSTINILGIRNEDNLINLTNTYQLIITNNIIKNNVFSIVEDLTYHANLEKPGWTIDTNSLSGLENVELGQKESYLVTIKVFSANNKRSKIIYQQEIENQNFYDFFKAPTHLNTSLQTKNIAVELITEANIPYQYNAKDICYIIFKDLENQQDTITIKFYRELKSNQFYQIDERTLIKKDLSDTMPQLINTQTNYDYFTIQTNNDNNISMTMGYKNARQAFTFATNKNFTLGIEKDNIFEKEDQGYPWCLYNDTLEDNVIYITYTDNARSNAKTTSNVDKGVFNYDYDKTRTINKINMYPHLPFNAKETGVQTIGFKITEMEKTNTSNISITGTEENHFTRKHISSTETYFTYGNNSENAEYIQLNTSSLNEENKCIDLLNLTATAAYIEIYNSATPNNILFKKENINNESFSLLNKQLGDCINNSLTIKIINGSVSSDDLKINYLQKVTANLSRKRQFYTDNIKLYLKHSSNDIIDYASIENGRVLTGQVLDHNEPVNLYIKDFADLRTEDTGQRELIYKIEKINEEYRPPQEIVFDNNNIIITQYGKIPFENKFLINPDTNMLTIKNTHIKKINFTEPQKDTIINCVLEKERS